MTKLMNSVSGLTAGAITVAAVLLVGFAGTAVARESATQKRAHAVSGGPSFEIRWQTLSGGSTFATGGNYQLRGSVGQVDADPGHPAQSGDFAHSGGFWSLFLGSESVQIMIFRDRFEAGGL